MNLRRTKKTQQIKKKFAIIFITFLLLLSFIASVKADGSFAVNFNQDTGFNVVWTSTASFIVYSGTLTGTAVLTTDSNGGTLTITPTTSGSLVCTSDAGSTFMINGGNYTDTPFGFGAATFTVTWGWTGIPTLPVNPFLPGINVNALMQYLWNRDFVGFILACYTSSMGEWFYFMLGSIIAGALYIRLKNLLVLTVAYILIGAVFLPVFVPAMPIVIICIIIAVATGLYKLWQHTT